MNDDSKSLARDFTTWAVVFVSAIVAFAGYTNLAIKVHCLEIRSEFQKERADDLAKRLQQHQLDRQR